MQPYVTPGRYAPAFAIHTDLLFHTACVRVPLTQAVLHNTLQSKSVFF